MDYELAGLYKPRHSTARGGHTGFHYNVYAFEDERVDDSKKKIEMLIGSTIGCNHNLRNQRPKYSI